MSTVQPNSLFRIAAGIGVLNQICQMFKWPYSQALVLNAIDMKF